MLGGFEADTGLTGRKLMADTYGGLAPHGGGALSGKDGIKVDRSGTHMARYIAKNIVVSKPEQADGKRHQRVDIYYNTIGLWSVPSPEQMEREYRAHYQAMQKRREKTA